MTEPNLEGRKERSAVSESGLGHQKISGEAAIERWGAALLDRLERFRGHEPLIVSPSKTAMPLVHYLARALEGEADLLHVRKLVDPNDSSSIVGAVSEWGAVFLNSIAHVKGLTMEQLREQVLKNIESMKIEHIEEDVPALNPEDRTVIMVDTESVAGDRLAAALNSLKTLIPKMIVLAVPVMSHRAFALLNNQCDEIIALEVQSAE